MLFVGVISCVCECQQSGGEQESFKKRVRGCEQKFCKKKIKKNEGCGVLLTQASNFLTPSSIIKRFFFQPFLWLLRAWRRRKGSELGEKNKEMFFMMLKPFSIDDLSMDLLRT